MKIISVVGARPNFMKIAPFIRAVQDYNFLNGTSSIEHILVHTGQHYDDRMSLLFFDDLKIPQADINLKVGSGTHAEQVGFTMIAFEKILKTEKPDWVVLVGDVNATLACSVTAKKEGIKCCHVEAGLRSGDLSMPEEINRLVTDRLSDLLLAPDRISVDNLLKEGVPYSKIKFVGNIMIDTLEANRDKAAKLGVLDIIRNNVLDEHNSLPTIRSIAHDENIALITMHRPSNVDNPEILRSIIDFLLKEVCRDLILLWPVHPRTEKNLKQFGFWNLLYKAENLILLRPLGYLELLRLNMAARIVLTDSGGIQEECTVLGTPCITLRSNTERPVTLRENGGVSVLVGNNVEKIRNEYIRSLREKHKPCRPELWDGYAAERCLKAILEFNEI